MSEQFTAPDTGADRTEYCCSIHVVPLDDGRVLVPDVIRNADTWMLRAFCIEPDGEIHGVVTEQPRAAERDGSVIFGASGDYGFDLRIAPEGPVHDTGWALGLGMVNLAARDYLAVRYRGSMWIGGRSYVVDSVGPASVHYGRLLPQYGYCVTMPGAHSSLLVASVARDNFRWLPIPQWTYGYGTGVLPPRIFGTGYFIGGAISLAPYGMLELFDLRTCPHELLGMPTVTATATAIFTPRSDASVSIGRVILDLRGEQFVKGIE